MSRGVTDSRNDCSIRREYHITVDLADYQTKVAIGMLTAQESARAAISRAQKQQKSHPNRQAKDPEVSVGNCACMHTFLKKSGRVYKFTRPFQGPCFVEVFKNKVQLKRVGQPKSKPL